MRTWLAIVVVAVVGSLALGSAAEPPESARSAHGGFTGQVKPVLYVRDVEKSAPFYRDALGFEFLRYANTDSGPYYAEMAAGQLKFGLHEPLSPAQEERVGRQRIYFRVKDLARHRERVAAWGGKPGEIHETSWMDMFTVEDFDGNQIVFAFTDPKKHTTDPW